MSITFPSTTYVSPKLDGTLLHTSLTARERAAVIEFLSALRAELGTALLSVTLFGSTARGETRVESDVDLLVLVDHELPLGELDRVHHCTFSIELEHNAVLSTLVMGPENRRWHERNQTLLWRNIAKDGIVLIAPPRRLREDPVDYAHPHEVIHLYMEHSNRCLAAAQALIDSELLQLRAISESYYAVFYAASAMLYAKGIERAKHSGVRSALAQFLIKTGELPNALGKTFDDLQRERESADYNMRYLPGPEIAHERLQQAQEFVDAAKTYLHERGFFNE